MLANQTATNRFRVVLLAAVVAAGTLAATPVRADDPTAIPPAPGQFVTDRAGFLSPAFATQLSQKLEDYERGTGHQVIVWIDRTTGGVPIEDWAVKAFKAWGVGRKGHDDGLALFVFSDDHRMRIEVGYGLEDKVPDARAGRIIQYDIAPRIRAGDHDGAIKAGVDSLIAAAGGAPEPQGRQSRGRGNEQLPGYVLWLIIFAVVIFGNWIRRRRSPGCFTYIGGGWGGGGWGGGGGGWGGGGGGGFSGGGGSSGGGGASGGW